MIANSYDLHFEIGEIPQKAKCDVCGKEYKKGDTMLSFTSQVKSMKPNIRICEECINELYFFILAAKIRADVFTEGDE